MNIKTLFNSTVITTKFFVGTFLSSLVLINCGGGTDPLERPTKAKGSLSSAGASGLASSDYASNFGAAASGSTDGGAVGSVTSGISGLGSYFSMTNKNTRTQSAFLKAFKLNSAAKVLEEEDTDYGAAPDLCDPTLSPADLTDADDDEIPLTATITYDCTMTGELPFTVKGSMTMTDKDDADAVGGFTAGISGLTMGFTADEASMSFGIDAALDGTKSADKYTAKYDLGFNMSVNAGGQSGSAFVGYYSDLVITPDNMEDPDTTGALTLTGFIKVKGSASMGSSESVDVVLGITTSGLKYAATCESSGGFSEGSMTLSDGSSNTLVAEFENCHATYKYNGTAVSATGMTMAK